MMVGGRSELIASQGICSLLEMKGGSRGVQAAAFKVTAQPTDMPQSKARDALLLRRTQASMTRTKKGILGVSCQVRSAVTQKL